MRAPRLATTVELAFALLSWLGGRQARTAMASAHPPDPHSCIAWSGQCFTHCASSQAAPFTGGCSIACPSRYFPCVSVCTRPCSGRRAVAVLREDSRPTLFTQTIHRAGGLYCTGKKTYSKKTYRPGGSRDTHTGHTDTRITQANGTGCHRFKNTGSRDTHSLDTLTMGKCRHS